MKDDEKKDTFILIDGNSLINRAFYAMPPLTNKKGVPTGAVFGFATMLLRAIGDYKPGFLAVAFDLKQPTFRHEMYPLYKAQRKKMPDDLAVQLPLLKEMLKAMDITIIEKPGFEADDIIGTMAVMSKNTLSTLIITGDRDAFQLIEGGVEVLLTRRGLSEIERFDAESLKRVYNLTPSQVVDYKALCGDSSDNIPGVDGVGDKTAVNLIEQYSSLDGVYKNIDKITGKLKERLIENKEQAYLSKTLAAIDTGVKLDVAISDCAFTFPFGNDLKQFCIENGFNAILKRSEIFADGAKSPHSAVQDSRKPVEVEKIDSIERLTEALKGIKGRFSFFMGEDIRFSTDGLKEYTVSLSGSFFDPGLSIGLALEEFKPYLENPALLTGVYEAKTLLKTLDGFGITLRNYFDVKLACYLLDSALAINSPEDLMRKNSFDKENELAAALYILTDECNNKLNEKQMTALYYDIELPLTGILFCMEKDGFKVDVKKLSDLGAEYSSLAEKLKAEVMAEAGQTFNLNSPKQLAKVLFEDMLIPYPKKSGPYSTGADILEEIEDSYPIVKKILRYRFLSKLNSTFVEGLLRASDNNGIIHTDFKQTVTATGRLSSVEPNLQNIPIREDEGRLLRGAFISKNTDGVIISADYSQIELRLMAHFSGDTAMAAAYKNGEDIHTTTAAKVFGVPTAEVTSKMRRDAKAVNFGIIYGISDFGLAKNLGIPVYVARQYIKTYFERFKGVKEYIDNSVAIAKKRGYAETLLGRQRRIPELYSSNFNIRSFGERVAMNMPLQGSAADIVKVAMLGVFKELKDKKSKLILQVHDELIVDAVKEEAEGVAVILKNCMESAAKLSVPLIAEVSVGYSWLGSK